MSYPNRDSHIRKRQLLRNTERIIVQDILVARISPANGEPTKNAHFRDLVLAYSNLFPKAQRIIIAFPITNCLITHRYQESVIPPLSYSGRASLRNQDPAIPSFGRYEDLERLLVTLFLVSEDLPDQVCVNWHPSEHEEHVYRYPFVFMDYEEADDKSCYWKMYWSVLRYLAVTTMTHHNVFFEAPPLSRSIRNRYFFVECEHCVENGHTFFQRDNMRARQILQIIQDEYDEDDNEDDRAEIAFEATDTVELMDIGRYEEADLADELENQQSVFDKCVHEWGQDNYQCLQQEGKDKLHFGLAGDASECECCAGLDLGFDWVSDYLA